LLLTPWPLATMVMAPLAGYLIEKCHAGLLGAIGLLVMACGLFGLALLPASPSDLDIIWRMALCGAGFGLFQSPNNHTIVASAPSHRSGGASGMLGTARLLGQSTGAALVALLFNLLAMLPPWIVLLYATNHYDNDPLNDHPPLQHPLCVDSLVAPSFPRLLLASHFAQTARVLAELERTTGYAVAGQGAARA
ncbi:MFS transporter, partial [Kosakonia oryzendophytica]|uniref:MFS transporter n=1 Tax=Kosakonia oryzendophytica TaxID=1005665 RepID=UPI002016A01B